MGALGDVLELLHRGGEGFVTVRATVRTWEHRERALAAWDAAHRRRATDAPALTPVLSGEATIREAVGRLWWDRAGGRLREEIEEGGARPRVLVRVGDRWWSYDDAWGARTNGGEPEAPHGAAFLHLLAPTWYLGALRITPTGRESIAGREALLARGEPRTGEEDGAWTLHDLGSGADAYELAIDAEHGSLLRVDALRGGTRFARAEMTEIAFDEPIEDERFAFAPPPGERLLPLDGDSTEHLRSLHELAERLPFPVYALPDGDGWTQLPQVMLPDAHPTGALTGLVAATRHEDAGSIELHLQRATRVTGAREHGEWRDEIRGGRRLRVLTANGEDQACVRLELDGTRMELRSENLDASALAELAAALVRIPAPAGSPA